MNKNFLGLIWACVSETTIFRPGVAFQFSHANITVTDYAIMDQDQAMLFKKKISVIQFIFNVQN